MTNSRLLKKAYLLLLNIHHEWAQDDAAHESPNDHCVVADFLREYEDSTPHTEGRDS